jgi:hypothetical protein
MRCDEKDRLLEEYAATAREFCEAVEQLRKCSNEVEAFIRTRDEAGRAHRKCERSRIQVDKHLAAHGC